MRSVSLPAFAKINLDLRVLGTRPDGFHDLQDRLSIARAVRQRDGDHAPRPARRDVRRARHPDRSAQSGVEGGVAAASRRSTGKTLGAARYRDRSAQARAVGSRPRRRQRERRDDAARAQQVVEARSRSRHADAHRRAARRRRAVLPGRRHRARPRARRRHLSAGRHAAGARRDPASRLRRRHRRCLSDGSTRSRGGRRRSPRRGRFRRAGRPGRPRSGTISRRRSCGITRPSAASASRWSTPAPTFAAMSGSGSAVFGLFERADAARRTANDLATARLAVAAHPDPAPHGIRAAGLPLQAS